MLIGDRTLQVARSLAWYEYAVIALSWVLVPLGGALGGLIGTMATIASARVLRSDRPAAARLGLTATISVGAVSGYFILAVLIGILIGQFTRGS